MKGSLSVLSAAVLVALAASWTDSNATNGSYLTAIKAASNGGANHAMPLIHKRRSKVAGSKKPEPSLRVPSIRHGRVNSPNGVNAVLYDQFGTLGSDGLAANNVASQSLFADQLADDFVVGADGWTVTGFNFLAFEYQGGSVNQAVDVYVYPDEGGLPGATAMCSSPASTNAASAFDNYTTLTAVTLNAVCTLPEGHYWVALAYVHPVGDGSYDYWLESSPNTNETGAYRSPGFAVVPECTDWRPASTCFPNQDGSNYDFAFQVLGIAGDSAGNGISLGLTLAKDDGSGANCGTDTALTANRDDRVNLCYTVTNNSQLALNYHSLTDSLAGQVFSLTPLDLEPGQSYSYVRTVIASPANDGTISATWTAQDAPPGYESDTTGASQFVDISDTGTNLHLLDNGEVAVSIPFSFNFYGTTTNLLLVGNDGAIGVGNSEGQIRGINYALPETPGKPTMYPLWDDFDHESGSVYVQARGTSPNQKFYIEWFNRVHSDSTDNTDGATFEVVIDQASGNFSFEYGDIEYTNTAGGSDAPDPVDCTGGLCATVGLEKDATLYHQFSYATASVTDGESIAWSPTINNVFTASDVATLDVVAPVISVDPPSLEATVASGGTGSSTLTIGNTGDADLDFTVDEAPHSRAGVGFPAVTHPFVHGQRNPSLTATKRAPRPTGTDGKAVFHGYGPNPQAAPGVPSFAYNSHEHEFVSLDATAPAALTPVGTLSDDPFPLGGTFINNDFTKEYVITYSAGTGASALATIDTATGVLTDIATLTGAAGVLVGPTWDITTGTLYAVSTDKAGSGAQLYAVDPTTGALSAAADVADVFLAAIAADGAGMLYGLDFNTASIVAIDKDTGESRQLVELPITPNYAQDMDVDLATNTLYYASYYANIFESYGEMYAIDLDTAALTDVGPIGEFSSELTAFAVAVEGSDCLIPSDVPWLSGDPASGTAPPAGSTQVTVNYDASSLAVGTYAAKVCVRSNDTTNRIVDVPVTLTVRNGVGDDVIFRDGFDGID